MIPYKTLKDSFDMLSSCDMFTHIRHVKTYQGVIDD